MQGDDRRVVALEVELSATVETDDLAHPKWLREHRGDDLVDAAVITIGKR